MWFVNKLISDFYNLPSGMYILHSCSGFPYDWGYAISLKFNKKTMLVIYCSLEINFVEGLYYCKHKDGVSGGWKKLSYTNHETL